MLRTELRAGDLGRLVGRQGTLYAAEYGWNVGFEAYVAESVARFGIERDPVRERLWQAEHDGELVGAIGIVAGGEDTAQLRWFFVAPSERGHGLGQRLLQEALSFCRGAGYRRVFLWTTSDLTTAARLYVRAGFERTERTTHELWGARVTEERYELVLEADGHDTER